MIPLVIAAAAIGTASALSARSSGRKQSKAQQEWAEYNAEVQYNIDINNIQSQSIITELNAKMVLDAANLSADANSALIEYNAVVREGTALYNDLLYEEDLANMWNQAGLDMELIGLQRAREAGAIEANQSASGTTMGIGSNADVLIDQKTQEALDLFITKTGANVKAAQINNARMQSLYVADQEIRQMLFEGRVQNNTSKLNAMLQSNALLAQGKIIEAADLTSATIRRDTGVSNAGMQSSMNNSQINSNFTSSMFGVAANTVSSFAYRAPISGSSPSTSSESVKLGSGPTTITANQTKIKLN